MKSHYPIAFLFDVDNTLLDNDRIKQDLGNRLDAEISRGSKATYWHHYEALRRELGHADFLRTFQRCWTESGRDPRWLPAANILLDYPFPNCVYPGAFATLRHLSAFGPVVIVSDGDAVMQPRKILRSGLWDSVGGRVLIFQNKIAQLATIAEHYPANHFVMIDDKLRVLEAMKQQWGERLTTIFPRQGHYASDPEHTDGRRPADLTIAAIGELATWPLDRFTLTPGDLPSRDRG